MNKKYASKWFRVATAGATVDGRTISPDHIKQMAKNFDPKLYGARVWLEHLRGTLPDSVFGALGDVTALKAEEQDGKMRLFAQLEPTARLVEINKARQKIYTSIEIDPRFADTGEAYMVGLAVTDTPASLGTEALQFTVKSKRPDDFEKHLFSAAEETALEFTEATEPPDTTGPIVAAFTSVLSAFGLKPAAAVKPEAAPPAASTAPAAFSAADLALAFTGLQTALADQHKATQAEVQKLTATVTAQAEQLQTLKSKVDTVAGQADPAHQHRRHAGPGGDAAKTDC